MKKHLFLTALLGSLSMVSCNNDPVKEDAPPVLLPIKINYESGNEKGKLTYSYDDNNRLTSFIVATNHRKESKLFTYDVKGALKSITLRAEKNFKIEYTISYSTDKVFIEEVVYFGDDYPNSPPSKSFDTITIDSNKNFIEGSNNFGSHNTCSYNEKGNLVKMTDASLDIVYDSENGMFKNVTTDPWVFIYFLRADLGQNFLNYKNNCKQIKINAPSTCDEVNFLISYNKERYPAKIHNYDCFNSVQTIEYSTVN